MRHTAVLAAGALALVGITWATAPRVAEPGLFADRGELFFPAFTDPNAANSLEVIQFNEQNGGVQPLKVINRNGVWTIPSHYDHPADAKDRLAQTAATIIALRKDDVSSDNPADHERCGVIDPTDAMRPGVRGRGTRVTIRGQNERPLADIIIGQPVDGHPGFRYVRLPAQKRTYLSRLGDLKISTAFGDWIDRDLLQVKSDDIDGVYIRSYSLDESSGRVRSGGGVIARKNRDGGWSLDGMQPGESIDANRMNVMIGSLAGLRIAGVLPKPQGISATLSGMSEQAKITVADRDDLARKGFYLTPGAELVSNEGEVVVHTVEGLFYTLRFGEVAPASAGSSSLASTDQSAAAPGRPAENRYLFIMVGFDAGSSPRGTQLSDAGEKRAAALRARFAPWYYIISSEEFAKIRARRSDLIKPKASAGARRPG
jgi:hypothetical protein